MRKFLLSLLIAFAVSPAVAETKLSVVATTGMIADTLRVIGGDEVEVKALMGPGVDPHAYRQTRTDIVAMTRADLVLWNGLYLEAQMEGFLTDLARRVPVVAVAEAVPQEMLRGHDDYSSKFDPHVWMDPALWRYVAIAVRDALIDVAPDHADVFTANAASYEDALLKLMATSQQALSSVPVESRVLLSAHDAFGYFGKAYGFEVMGIQGISTESEAGLNRIETLVDLLVARDIRAVFVETSVSDRSIRALIEGAAAQGHEVTIGGELFSDAMGSDGTLEGTYLGMIAHNVETIATALGGSLPVGGVLAENGDDS